MDWLHDDTLIIAASIPVKSTDTIVEGEKRGKNKRKQSSNVQATEKSKYTFDIAFTILRVADLFTGGYTHTKSKMDGVGQDQGEDEGVRVTEPCVCVLRSQPYDLEGMKCIPSALPLAPIPSLTPTTRRTRGVSGRAWMDERDNNNDNNDEDEEYSHSVSVVLWCGSQMLALTMPAVRTNPTTVTTTATGALAATKNILMKKIPTPVIEVEAIFMDVSTLIVVNG